MMDNLTSLNLTNSSTPENLTAIGPVLNPPRVWTMVLLSTDLAWLLRYALPVTVALGIFGNTVTFLTIILRRLYKKSAIFVFFAFISVNDLLYIIIGLVDVIDVYAQRHYMVTTDLLCAFRFYALISSSVTSVWVLVAAAMYKMYVLVFPMKAYRQESAKTSLIICTTITATVYLAYLHLFWVSGMNVKGIIDDTPFINCYVIGDVYPAYEATFIAVDVVIYSLLPAVLLIASSITMIVFFTRSYLQHKRLMSSETNQSTNPSRISPTYRSTRFTILMILPVSILFIVMTLPMTVIIYYIHDPNDYYTYVSIAVITIYCTHINHSMNVYLQFLISSSFRDALLGRKSPGTRIGQRAAAVLYSKQGKNSVKGGRSKKI